MMNSSHHEDDGNIVVEYDEDDPEMEELLQVSAVSHDFKYDDEDHTDGDEYGGMSHELYNDIVTFKKSDNTKYPSSLNSRQDRSALSHWRARCQRYVMATDNETLMYCNQASSVSDAPKVVVKKGEVRRVIERVHELIGHLGQKRTQMAVLKKLHWRSVRQDVKTYILSCDFCNQKKLDGKKILKAPVDISSDNFGFTVEARFGQNIPDGERLHISLVGYNEHEVQAAAMTRMTSYTFKETVSEMRGGRYGRTLKPEFLAAGTSVAFRRQPYIRRSRYTPYSSFILPYTPKGPKEEPEFIIYNPSRGDATSYPAEEYEVEEGMVVDNRHHAQEQIHVMAPEHLDDRQAMPSDVKEEMILYETQHPAKRGVTTGSSLVTTRKERFTRPQAAGIASRYSFSVGTTEHIGQNSADLLSSMEAVQSRAEMVGLAPVMMMPSTDPEVITLQKELLTRQLHIQELQEKVLQRQLEDDRIARYEQIDPQAGRMQILEDSNEAAIEELNVMDSGEDEEIIKQYQRA